LGESLQVVEVWGRKGDLLKERCIPKRFGRLCVERPSPCEKNLQRVDSKQKERDRGDKIVQLQIWGSGSRATPENRSSRARKTGRWGGTRSAKNHLDFAGSTRRKTSGGKKTRGLGIKKRGPNSHAKKWSRQGSGKALADAIPRGMQPADEVRRRHDESQCEKGERRFPTSYRRKNRAVGQKKDARMIGGEGTTREEVYLKENKELRNDLRPGRGR